MGVVIWAVVTVGVAAAAAALAFAVARRRHAAAHSRTQRALADSERKYQTLFTVANHAVFLADVDSGRIIDCNPRAEELVGLPRDQIVGIRTFDIHPPGEADHYRALFEEMMRAGGGSLVDVPVWHRSGYAVPVDITSRLITVNDRHIALGVFRHTQRSEGLGEVLRRERSLTDAVIDTVQALVVVLDREGCVRRFNRACEHATGFSFEEVRGRRFWEIMLPQHEVPRIREMFAELLAGHFPTQHEGAWLTRNGAERIIAWANSAILDDQGQVQYVIATGIDVTARRATEAALRRAHDEMERRVVLRTAALRSANDALVQSEARLAEAQRIAHVGSWEWDVRSGRINWSDETFRIFGHEPGAIAPSYSTFLKQVHADDRPRLQAAVDRALAEGEYGVTHRIVKPDGGECVVHSHGVTGYGEAREPLRLVGTVQDITERYAAEEELRRAHSELEERVAERTVELSLANQALGFTQFAMDHAADAVFWMGKDSEFIYVNDAACRLLDYERDQLLGQKCLVVCLGFGVNCKDGAHLAREGTFESSFRRRDGVAVPVEITASHLAFDGIEYTCLFARDVSERRRAEVARAAQLQAARTLSTVSSRLVSGEDILGAISDALTDLRALLRARCASLFRVEEGDLVMELEAGGAGESGCITPIHLERYREVFGELERGEVQVLEGDEGGASVLVPMFVERTLSGVIAFEDAREVEAWREGDFPLLRVAARVITNGIGRHNAELQTMRLLEENRRVARESLDIQERERAHLARELHDEMGQCLTAIRADAQSICRLSQEGDPRIYASGKAIGDVASRVYEVVRNIMRRLRPEMLDELGLGAALNDIIKQWRNRHPEMEWVLELSEPMGELPEAAQITAFRVVQESITNVIKHAGATRVEVRAMRTDGRLVVTVADNGHGLSPLANRGMGLLGMRERVLSAGGEFRVINKPGEGYRIEARFPLNERGALRNAG